MRYISWWEKEKHINRYCAKWKWRDTEWVKYKGTFQHYQEPHPKALLHMTVAPGVQMTKRYWNKETHHKPLEGGSGICTIVRLLWQFIWNNNNVCARLYGTIFIIQIVIKGKPALFLFFQESLPCVCLCTHTHKHTHYLIAELSRDLHNTQCTHQTLVRCRKRKEDVDSKNTKNFMISHEEKKTWRKLKPLRTQAIVNILR